MSRLVDPVRHHWHAALGMEHADCLWPSRLGWRRRSSWPSCARSVTRGHQPVAPLPAAPAHLEKGQGTGGLLKEVRLVTWLRGGGGGGRAATCPLPRIPAGLGSLRPFLRWLLRPDPKPGPPQCKVVDSWRALLNQLSPLPGPQILPGVHRGHPGLPSKGRGAAPPLGGSAQQGPHTAGPRGRHAPSGLAQVARRGPVYEPGRRCMGGRTMSSLRPRSPYSPTPMARPRRTRRMGAKARAKGVTRVLTARTRRTKTGRWGRRQSAPRPASRRFLRTCPVCREPPTATSTPSWRKYRQRLLAKEYCRGPLLALDIGARLVHADILPRNPQPLFRG